MLLGAHVSTAGGLHQAFSRGEAVGCETIMVFTKSNRQWRARPITEEDETLYQATAQKYPQIQSVAVHASYLINLASPDEVLWERSKEALYVEWQRAAQMGMETVTFHPGSAVDGDTQAGLERIVRGLSWIVEQTQESTLQTTLCLETMAGQGSQLGFSFEHLAYILQTVGASPQQLGICLDTCHIFAAGYPMRTQQEYTETMTELDRIVGLKHIQCFHLNDSVHPLGSRKDRHAHIGEGEIGIEGFAALLNDPIWSGHPGYLETPKTRKEAKVSKGTKVRKTKTASIEMDSVNLERLRALQQA